MSGDRPKQYKDLAESCQWTPAQCASIPLVVQSAIWGERVGRLTPGQELEALNLRRARKGLPPLTAEQAAENAKKARESIRYG